MGMIDNIIAIQTFTKEQRVNVTSNKKIREIVFHPLESIMYIRAEGKDWRKVKYEAMSMVDDIIAIQQATTTKEQQVKVTSNKKIDEIVFHPSKPVMYVKMDGKNWNKVKYEAVK